MSQEVLYKTNQITEDYMDFIKKAYDYGSDALGAVGDYASDKIGDFTGGAYKPDFRGGGYFAQTRGLEQFGGLKPAIAKAVTDKRIEAGERGADEAAVAGAGSGAALGASIASGGIPRLIAKVMQGKGLFGKLGNLVGGAIGAGTRGVIGGGLGAGAGAIAGYKGGLPAGARAVGAAGLGTPLALALGPYAGLGAGAVGAALGGDAMTATQKAFDQLRRGGADGTIFGAKS